MFTVLNVDIKKLEKWQKSHFISQGTKKREQSKPNISIRKKIVKIRGKINEIEIRKTIEKINKTKLILYKKFLKITNL